MLREHLDLFSACLSAVAVVVHVGCDAPACTGAHDADYFIEFKDTHDPDPGFDVSWATNVYDSPGPRFVRFKFFTPNLTPPVEDLLEVYAGSTRLAVSSLFVDDLFDIGGCPHDVVDYGIPTGAGEYLLVHRRGTAPAGGAPYHGEIEWETFEDEPALVGVLSIR